MKKGAPKPDAPFLFSITPNRASFSLYDTAKMAKIIDLPGGPQNLRGLQFDLRHTADLLRLLLAVSENQPLTPKDRITARFLLDSYFDAFFGKGGAA